jgi:polysaccharide pyruvyl transferase WcaK-like protein
MVDTDRDRKLLLGLGVPIIDSDDPSIVRSVIANLSLAVCSRYHGLVNCLVHGVPVIALGWQHKYRGLMQYFELLDFDHPLAESSGQLSDRLGTLADSRDRLSRHIGGKLSQARAEISASMSGLSSRLGGPASVLTAPVKFDNATIETVSHIRAAPSVRLWRGMKRLVAA